MAERVQKVLGEGGAHLHRLESPVKTAEDGFHKHLFFVNDRLVMTDLSGAHAHAVDAKSSTVGPELQAHKHLVPINTQEGLVVFETDAGGTHAHELQSQTTTLSGLHTHILMLGEEGYLSLLPGDLIDAVDAATKQDPSLKNFKLKKSDNPLEMNFELVKRLNADDFKPVMKKAVFATIVKALSNLDDGLQVESLILSKSRFFDVGVATRFVLDSGLAINGMAETPENYIFNVRAKDKFDESSLQRVRLTDGVEAVIGLLLEDQADDGSGAAVQASGLPELTDRNKEGDAVGLQELQAKRATEFGIEALTLDDAALTPEAGTVGWGDPVNFRFPLDDAKSVTAAVKNFGDNIGGYQNESSKKRVAERIASAAVKTSVVIANDSEIWNYLSQKTRELFVKPEVEPAGSLKSKFTGFMSSIMEGEEPAAKPVAKSAPAPKKKADLINWKTDKPISGTGAAKVIEIAKTLGVDRKYVTVEAAQKRFIEFLVSKYEVKNAVYADTAQQDEAQTEKFLSFEIRGEGIDAILFSEELNTNAWRKSLVIFFDDSEKLDEIFKTEIKNHSFGAYELKQSMMGPVLYPITIDKEVTPILDEELLKALEADTTLFFSKHVENFFNGENPIKKKLPYKRGVLMYGPPGNGKTTFIKHFITHFEGSYSILVDARDFEANIGKFLEQSLGRDAKKVIVFEDVDAIAGRYEMRSTFLNFLDGAVGLHKTLIIATTNYPGMLDDALLKRPSRFDQKYKISLPNEGMRAKFLMHFFPDLSNADLIKHVKATANFSGAYFKEIFILKGMRQCSVTKAIELVQSAMSDVRKSVAEADQEEIAWMIDDEMEIGDIARASMISKGLRAIAEDIAEGVKTEEVESTPSADGTEALKVSLFFDIAKADVEQRLVIGPVLVPENFDLQDDIISEEEIAKAAHNYLIKLNFSADPEFLKSLGLNEKSKRGFMHTEFNRKIALVESYLAPVDFTLNERAIKAGTWVMAVKVFDDEVWSLVKAKRITGFSIGGRSRSIPVEA